MRALGKRFDNIRREIWIKQCERVIKIEKKTFLKKDEMIKKRFDEMEEEENSNLNKNKK